MRKLTINEASKNPKLINEFIKQNLGLVYYTVKKFHLSPENYEDAVQEALLSFYRCIVNYNPDPENDGTFVKYCVIWMEGSIMQMLRRGYYKNIRPPRWYYLVNKLLKNGASIDEISERVNKTPKEIENCVNTMMYSSLDAEINNNPEGTNLNDKYSICNKGEFDPDSKELRLLINFANTLKDSQKQILLMKYCGYKQGEIAEYLGVAQPNISRTLKRIKPKLLQFLYNN